MDSISSENFLYRAFQTNRARSILSFIVFASVLIALTGCDAERESNPGNKTQVAPPDPVEEAQTAVPKKTPKNQGNAEAEDVVPPTEPETPPAPDPQEPEPKSLAELAREIRPAVLLLETVSRKGDRSIGTGFFVSEEGEFVTNWHVVEDAVEVVASEINEDGSRGAEHTEIEILRKNVQGDLALLKATTKPKKFLNLGQAEEAEVGEPVVVFGNPKGLSGTLSEGIISARRVLEGGYSWVQITAPISPGSSGSPLLSLQGDVWGVVSWQRKDGQNLNFSSPVEAVADLLEGNQVEEVESGRLSPLWSLENEKAVEEEWATLMEEGPSNLAVLEKARFLHRKYPESISARKILIGRYMVLEMHPEAKKEISELLEIDPENYVALLFLARCGSYEHDWKLMEFAASRGVKVDPSNFEMWKHLFYAHYNLENDAEAVRTGKMAIKLGDDRLSEIFEAENEDHSGILQEMAFLNDSYGKIRTFKGRDSMNEGQVAFAKIQFEYARNSFFKAIGLLEKVLTLSKENPNAGSESYERKLKWQISESWRHHGLVLLEEGKAKEALVSLKKAVATAPDNAQAMLNVGDAYLELGNHELARESGRRAYEAATDEPLRQEIGTALVGKCPGIGLVS